MGFVAMKLGTRDRQRLAPESHDVGFGVFVGLVLCGEALGIILTSPHRMLGTDGQLYALYAHNLVAHGIYSDSAHAPLQPSVFRSPGYPFFLAGLRLIGGDPIVVVRVAQFVVLGILSYIVYCTGRRAGGRLIARIAALLCVTYLPFLWLARMELTETVVTTLLAAVVLFVIQIRKEPRSWRFIACGLSLAIASLIRPEFALLIVPIGAGLLLASSRRRTAGVAWGCGVMLVIFLLALTPWTIRNLNLTHTFEPFGTDDSGQSLLASAEQYEGRLGYSFDRSLGAVVLPIIHRADATAHAEKSSVPLNVREELAANQAERSAARRIAGHLSAGGVLSQLPKRIAYLWAVADYPGTSNYALWHNLARLEHFLLLILAATGAAIGIRRVGIGVVWPLLLLPVYSTMVHLIFQADARYTMPTRMTLMVLAALAAERLWLSAEARMKAHGRPLGRISS
jgi:4-amino-4-deoxy-L-arabinose transferase-like glycosyltransferase